jgi:hypothetical protein
VNNLNERTVFYVIMAGVLYQTALALLVTPWTPTTVWQQIIRYKECLSIVVYEGCKVKHAFNDEAVKVQYSEWNKSHSAVNILIARQ